MIAELKITRTVGDLAQVVLDLEVLDQEVQDQGRREAAAAFEVPQVVSHETLDSALRAGSALIDVQAFIDTDHIQGDATEQPLEVKDSTTCFLLIFVRFRTLILV